MRQHHQVPGQETNRRQAHPDQGVFTDHDVAHVEHEEHGRSGEYGDGVAYSLIVDGDFVCPVGRRRREK